MLPLRLTLEVDHIPAVRRAEGREKKKLWISFIPTQCGSVHHESPMDAAMPPPHDEASGRA